MKLFQSYSNSYQHYGTQCSSKGCLVCAGIHESSRLTTTPFNIKNSNNDYVVHRKLVNNRLLLKIFPMLVRYKDGTVSQTRIWIASLSTTNNSSSKK